ncbi:Aldehyde/histidinol dehydrogenase, partial [Phascolomyces articulosus]
LNSSDKTYIRKEPKGVVLVIAAWNYPVQLLLAPVVGAIAAGNCAVIKPSEVAEATNSLIVEQLPKYLDPRAYTVVSAGVVETTALLEQKFDHIFYTGNGMVGKIVMTAAAKHLTPVTLELGGKSPAIVCDSADINLTAHRLLWGKFYNSGQTCVAPDYVIVSHDKLEALTKAFRKTVKEFFGNNPQESQSYGRIINHRQFDRLQKILDTVDQSKIIIGGQTDRENLFITPTIVGPVDADDPYIMEDEIFGPILPIVAIKNLTEAVKVINSKQTNSGGTLVNDTLMHLQEMSLPFGGVGPSGMGSYHGDCSFDTFTHERSTMIKSTALEATNQARYPPYTDSKKELMSVFILGLPLGTYAKAKAISNAVGAFCNVLFSSSETSQNSKL